MHDPHLLRGHQADLRHRHAARRYAEIIGTWVDGQTDCGEGRQVSGVRLARSDGLYLCSVVWIAGLGRILG
jgi:hypothetical protein